MTLIFSIILRASTNSTKRVYAGSFMWPKFGITLEYFPNILRFETTSPCNCLHITTVQGPIAPLKTLPNQRETTPMSQHNGTKTLLVHWNLFSLHFFQPICIMRGPPFHFGWISIWKTVVWANSPRHQGWQLARSLSLLTVLQCATPHSCTGRLAFPFFSSPRPRWLSWGIISDAVSALVGHSHFENFIKQNTVHDFSCQWITLFKCTVWTVM